MRRARGISGADAGGCYAGRVKGGRAFEQEGEPFIRDRLSIDGRRWDCSVISLSVVCPSTKALPVVARVARRARSLS